MANVTRLSSSSSFDLLNYSFVTRPASSSKALQPALTCKNNSGKRSHYLSCSSSFSRAAFTRTRNQYLPFKVNSTITEATEQPKWWEKNAGPNMIDIHSPDEFWAALSEAEERLVIVEFYGTWCGSCRALFPKLCRAAEEHPEILFLKVNFDENKPLCKSLNVKVLPNFHFYRGGADGLLETFSCSFTKFQKVRDAITKHSIAGSSIGPPEGPGCRSLDS